MGILITFRGGPNSSTILSGERAEELLRGIGWFDKPDDAIGKRIVLDYFLKDAPMLSKVGVEEMLRSHGAVWESRFVYELVGSDNHTFRFEYVGIDGDIDSRKRTRAAMENLHQAKSVKELLSVGEVNQHLKDGWKLIDRYVQNSGTAGGRMPAAIRIGDRAVRWSYEELQAWANAGCPERKEWKWPK